MNWTFWRKSGDGSSLPVACEPTAPDPLEEFSDDDIRRVALEYVYGVGESDPSWCGGTLVKCDSADQRIAAARAKYADFEPSKVRAAIMRWLDYYQTQNDENRRDVETQESRRRQDAYSTKCAEQDRRAAQLRALLPPRRP